MGPRATCCAVLLGLMLFSGCGSKSKIPLGTVAGRVTFYGRPVRADIVFQPQGEDGRAAGRPSTAMSDAEGEYALAFSPEEAGAVVGRHRVTVKILPFADRGEPATLQEATKPLKTIVMERAVRAGSNRYDFAVTW